MVKLGDVATYLNGCAFKPSEWSSKGLAIIRIQNLTGSFNNVNYYNGEYNPRYEINDGDVLISWSASLGVYEWKEGKALLNQHIFKVVFDKLKVDKKYFMFTVKSLLHDMSKETHGSTMKHITKPRFDNMPFPLPPLAEQKKIADVLDKASELIELRKKQITKLDLLVKARFVEMFGDPVTNPMGWKISTIGESCFSVKDGPHVSPQYVDEGIPFISVRNIVNKKICFKDAKYITRADYIQYTRKSKPEKGDILYSKGGTTGIAKVIDIDIEFCNWVHLAVLKFCNDNLSSIFFENMLNSYYCYQQSQKLTKGIANRDLVLGAMKTISFFVPPLSLQTQFADFVTQAEKQKESMSQGLAKLEMQYKALMQQYFN